MIIYKATIIINNYENFVKMYLYLIKNISKDKNNPELFSGKFRKFFIK